MKGFLDAHRSFGDVAGLYANRITVAASAQGGRGKVAIHGRTQAGASIGGLFDVDSARALVEKLTAAIEYAEMVAREQRVSSIPDLERQLAEAVASSDRMEGEG